MLNSFDITWNAGVVALCGIVECSVAAIIASLPALNQTFIGVYKRTVRGERLPRVHGSASSTNGLISSIIERLQDSLRSSNGTVGGREATVIPPYVETLDRACLKVPQASQGKSQAQTIDSYSEITGYYANEEMASDLEKQELPDAEHYEQEDGDGDRIGAMPVSRRMKNHPSSRRPSSPTINISQRSN
ncbi:hypothetical protein TWF694_002176 [Orbilia ellipsospora]|uniref:Integral membrane protein n=1 Tax=Orbilia ellipsospora TaxID=2528407 RepID=A0AAV9X4T8_9PEZI